MGGSFGDELGRLADADPDRPALTCDGVTLTRRELLQRARRLADCLDAHGVTPGSVIGIGLPNSIEHVETILATWWLGATPMPISPRLAPGERGAILDLAQPALVVGIPAEQSAGGPVLSDAQVRAVAEATDGPECDREPAVSPFWKITTTGGSTGRPKLIVPAQAAETSWLATFSGLFALPAAGCVLVTGPLSHNAPFVMTGMGLLRGCHVVLMPRFDAAQTLELVERHRVDWLYLVPTMMHRIWRLPEREEHDVSSLRVVYHMAAPCPPWLKRAWIDWLGPEVIWELYGGTEGQAITVITGPEWLAHPGSVGRSAIGEIEPRGDDGRPLRPDEIGELWMRRGADQPAVYHYIGAEPRAAADGWESLGDIGYLDADGYVYLTDRRTDMFVVGGANVYPAEIEAALDEHPAVRSCCVIGLPHEDLGNAAHAIVQLTEPVDDESLLEHLRERLAPYKVPRSIERVDTPLRDDAGKVRRPALRMARVGTRNEEGTG